MRLQLWSPHLSYRAYVAIVLAVFANTAGAQALAGCLREFAMKAPMLPGGMLSTGDQVMKGLSGSASPCSAGGGWPGGFQAPAQGDWAPMADRDAQQLRAKFVRDPSLDGVCPGKVPQSMGVGAECWASVWVRGGCKAENVPAYESWHEHQSLEVLIADVAQWAHLPDERHRQGCYGSAGPPASQPVLNYGTGVGPESTAGLNGRERSSEASKPRRAGSASSPLHGRDELLALFGTAGSRPVVLQFWAETCGFCNLMHPVFELLAEKYRGRAYFRSVDVQTDSEVATMFEILGLPAFRAVLQSQVFQQVDGADPSGLEQLVEMSVREADRHDVHLSREDLRDFLRSRDPGRDAHSSEDVEKLMQHYLGDVPQLLDLLEERYGARPRTTGGYIAGLEPSRDGAVQMGKEEGVANVGTDRRSCSLDVGELGDEDLLAQIRALQQELREREATKGRGAPNPCADARVGAAGAEDMDGTNTFVERLVIIGGGPAGMAAALYGARAGLCPLVVAPPLGGQLLAKGVDVENYPGIGRTRGSAIIHDMRTQAVSFLAEFRGDTVLSVNLSTRPFVLYLNNSSVIRTQTLIVATGADSRWLGVKGEDELRGFGVSSCAACDGPLFRDKLCVVIGGGDTAAEEALLLARLCASVSIVHRREQLSAGHRLQQRVLNHTMVKVLWNSEIQEFIGEPFHEGSQRLVGVLIRDARSGEITQLPADAAFVAIGHDPNTAMLRGQVRMDEVTGYLETKGPGSQTSVPGVFAAGDVADPTYRQAITSAGSGAAAALDAERWLSER